ncbi:MAG: hypothetical protein R3301_16560 [Saprospiraceae bacterium]|nr:hypothetical protein [Saprospiraceae bacterium]
MNTSLLTILAICCTLTTTAFTTSSDPWVKLGSRKANMKADQDEILVTGAKGTFNALKLTVEETGVMFHRVVVHYRNGTREVLDIRHRIEAGGETRVLNLKGRNRIIRRVVFHYQSNPLADKKAKITLYGRH